MKYSIEPLNNRHLTVKRIRGLVCNYHTDLSDIEIDGKTIGEYSLIEFFNLVKTIPYRMDKKPIEIIARPKHIFKYAHLGMDCKKKTVLCASYCELTGRKYRYIGSSIRLDKKIHHIFIQIQRHNDTWSNMDATYPENELFEPKKVTHYEIF